MQTGWIILTLCVSWINYTLSANPTINTSWNATFTDTLKRSLLQNYDKFARPSEHFNVTHVDIGLTIRHIDIDEIKSTLTAHGWIKFNWIDEKLTWNKTLYGEVKQLHLAEHEIWQPDIMLYNTALGSSSDQLGNAPILVQSDGTVFWVPMTHLTVFCTLNLKYWPYDRHTCSLIFGSWTYSANSIDLKSSGINTEFLIEGHKWKVVELTSQRNVKTYECCEEPYVDISFNITIQRRSPMYETLIVSPATIIILLILATFWLPPLSGDKILLNGIIILILSGFLMFFTTKLEIMADHTPLIVTFYSTCLYLACFATFISVIVLNLARNKHAYTIPYILKTLLDGPFGTLLGLKHVYTPPAAVSSGLQQRGEELRENTFDDHATSEDHHMIQPVKKIPNQQDWILLATAIDRIAFIVYCFLFVIYAVAYSV